MAVVKQESRSRIGIVWYDTPEEANAVAERYKQPQYAESVANANIGYAQVGRATHYDAPGEYAVITP